MHLLNTAVRLALHTALALLVALLLAGEAMAQVVNYDLTTTSVLRINLPVSQAVTVTVSEPVTKLTVADPKIADAQPITSKSLYVVGKSFGKTTVNLYDAQGNPVGLLALEIGADTADMTRTIKQLVPYSRVKVTTVNGRIGLSGSVPDADAKQKVLDVATQYGLDATSIIDAVTFSGSQQVNLEVRILEAERSAGRELGINWGAGSAAQFSPGAAIGQHILTGGTSGGIIGASGSNVAGTGNTFATFIANVLTGGGNLDLVVNALEAKGLARTLADPNLTTLSGGSASFLAGGQVPIRVPDANGNATLTYKDFGVRLVFTPVVLDGNRIQIRLTPEVTDFTGYTPQNDPIFTTRTLDATVELRDGQSFSVAGLMQSHTKLSQNQLPWLGDVPVIGALFKSSSYQKDETELVVIVTPRLVQPSSPRQALATPFDKTAPANDGDFFLGGQMELARQPPIKPPGTLKSGYILNLGTGK